VNVKLVAVTHPRIEGISDAEELISYCARVSNPKNQLNTETAPKLLKYLIKHKHWSPFEMASATFEIVTSRAIAAQILRHRSFSFQEFSQRYSSITEIEPVELRKQAVKNRQSSEDVIDEPVINNVVQYSLDHSVQTYEKLINQGVAKEQARMVLPLATKTTMYMTGTFRSWVHYIDLRSQEDTQKEHRDIAIELKNVFTEEFKTISEALGWR